MKDKEIGGFEITGLEQKILDIINEYDKVIIDEMAVLCSSTKRTIERAIYSLKNKKAIRTINSRKNGFWEIIKNN